MAKILIIEPHPEVRELLARVVARLGLDPVLFADPGAHDLSEFDVVLVEPAAWDALAVSRAAKAHGATVVFVSIFPASEETRAVEPVAYLHKPFSLADLERAILAAVDARKHIPAA